MADATYDANLLAGPLTDVLAAEMTTAYARCGGCGHDSLIAQLRVYGPGPGLVARCPDCTHVLLRLVETREAIWLDLSGTSVLRVTPSEWRPRRTHPGNWMECHE